MVDLFKKQLHLGIDTGVRFVMRIQALRTHFPVVMDELQAD